MRRLIDVIEHGRADPTPLLTPAFSLNQIKEARELSGRRARRRDREVISLEGLPEKYREVYEEDSGFVD
jgi:hypothetical protein